MFSLPRKVQTQTGGLGSRNKKKIQNAEWENGGQNRAQAGSLASWKSEKWERLFIGYPGSTYTVQEPLPRLQPHNVCAPPAPGALFHQQFNCTSYTFRLS